MVPPIHLFNYCMANSHPPNSWVHWTANAEYQEQTALFLVEDKESQTLLQKADGNGNLVSRSHPSLLPAFPGAQQSQLLIVRECTKTIKIGPTIPRGHAFEVAGTSKGT